MQWNSHCPNWGNSNNFEKKKSNSVRFDVLVGLNRQWTSWWCFLAVELKNDLSTIIIIIDKYCKTVKLLHKSVSIAEFKLNTFSPLFHNFAHLSSTFFVPNYQQNIRKPFSERNKKKQRKNTQIHTANSITHKMNKEKGINNQLWQTKIRQFKTKKKQTQQQIINANENI